jgi:hypothetical protein
MGFNLAFKRLNAQLNLICHLLAILRAHHILHFSRIKVNEGHKPTAMNVNTVHTEPDNRSMCLLSINRNRFYFTGIKTT